MLTEKNKFFKIIAASIQRSRFLSRRAATLLAIMLAYGGCGLADSGHSESTGPTQLRIEQDDEAGTIAIYHADGTEPIVTQNARPGFRPYLHPINAPVTAS